MVRGISSKEIMTEEVIEFSFPRRSKSLGFKVGDVVKCDGNELIIVKVVGNVYQLRWPWATVVSVIAHRNELVKS
jgi:hypothetical protein